MAIILVILCTSLICSSVAFAQEDNVDSLKTNDDNGQNVQSNIETNIQKHDKEIKTTTTVSNYEELSKAMTKNANQTINMQKTTYKITNPTIAVNTNNNVIINGNGAVIDGQNKYHFLAMLGKNTTLTINNLTIKNTRNSSKYNTGAIYCENVTLNLNNINFTNNNGGAVYTTNTNLTTNHCEFTKNIASEGSAILCDEFSKKAKNNVIVKNSKFTNNRNETITIIDVNNFILTSNVFDSNNYGVITCINSKPTITNNIFKNIKTNLPKINIAAIVVDCENSTSTIDNNTFNNINITAYGVSGGIIGSVEGSINVTNNKFTNIKINSTGKDDDESGIYGGVLFISDSDSRVTSNVFNNKVQGDFACGATIFNSNGTMTLGKNTFQTQVLNTFIYAGIIANMEATLKHGDNDYTKCVNRALFNDTTSRIYNMGGTLKSVSFQTIKVNAPKSIDTAKTAAINIRVTNAKNNPISTTVILKVNGLTVKDKNGKTVQLNLKNGSTTYNLPLAGYSAKTYNITAVATKTGYEREESTTTMTVNKGKYDNVAFTIDATSEEVITINRTLKDVNGNIICGNTKVAIKIGGKTVLTTTAVDGKLYTKFKLPYLPSGQLKMMIILGENNRYTQKIINSTAVIHKQNVNINMTRQTSKIGRNVTITARLTNAKTLTNVISGKYIFKLNGATLPFFDNNGGQIYTTHDVSNGVAMITFTVPNTAKIGLNNITIAYNGNTQSNSAKYTNSVLTVTK